MLPSRLVFTGEYSVFLGIWDDANGRRFMGSLTNNSRKLANFAGFYKGIQSAGQAIAWR